MNSLGHYEGAIATLHESALAFDRVAYVAGAEALGLDLLELRKIARNSP